MVWLLNIISHRKIFQIIASPHLKPTECIIKLNCGYYIWHSVLSTWRKEAENTHLLLSCLWGWLWIKFGHRQCTLGIFDFIFVPLHLNIACCSVFWICYTHLLFKTMLVGTLHPPTSQSTRLKIVSLPSCLYCSA